VKYLTRRYGDLCTVISPAGFVCVQEPRAACEAKLATLGIDPAILEERNTRAEWHAMFAHAAAAEATAATSALASAATVADVEAVANKQAELTAAVSELRSEVAREQRRAEMQQLEAELDAEADRIRGVLKSKKQGPSTFTENLMWGELFKTPAGKRLLELREDQ
jgi:hypothetical protein